jgi:hypothetical protein
MSNEQQNVAIKTLVCPRCRGSGLMNVDVTLPGIAPLLDRPSGVDDDAWDLPEDAVDKDKTTVREVPTFKLPKRLYVEVGVHPLAPALVASSVSLPPIPRSKEALPAAAPRRRGLVWILIASTALIAALAVAGMARRNLWLPALHRVLVRYDVPIHLP